MPENTVYVGRPTKWGNPFVVGESSDEPHLRMINQIEAVKAYERYIVMQFYRKDIIAELKGKNLACWCRVDKPCHADILLDIANV